MTDKKREKYAIEGGKETVVALLEGTDDDEWVPLEDVQLEPVSEDQDNE